MFAELVEWNWSRGVRWKQRSFVVRYVVHVVNVFCRCLPSSPPNDDDNDDDNGNEDDEEQCNCDTNDQCNWQTSTSNCTTSSLLSNIADQAIHCKRVPWNIDQTKPLLTSKHRHKRSSATAE